MKVKINNKVVNAKLPKRFKERWVKALKSGRFLQGKHVLKNEDSKYCCLGVACSILTKDNFYYPKNSSSSPFVDRDGYDFIPKALKDNKDLQVKLATYNDKGKSFKWIAAYIERYL